jgi:hypothetical protein
VDRYYKILIIIIVAFVILGGASLYYLLYIKAPTPDIVESKTTDEVVEEYFTPTPIPTVTPGSSSTSEDKETEKSKTVIGTQGVSKGIFSKVEAGFIFIKDGSLNVKVPLTTDEVVLACTSQSLFSATELDYDQVTSVKISNPQEIGSLIPVGENIVLFASDVAGTSRVHTVAMDEDNCQ